jgi:hypothetical protein
MPPLRRWRARARLQVSAKIFATALAIRCRGAYHYIVTLTKRGSNMLTVYAPEVEKLDTNDVNMGDNLIEANASYVLPVVIEAVPNFNAKFCFFVVNENKFLPFSRCKDENKMMEFASVEAAREYIENNLQKYQRWTFQLWSKESLC